MTFKQHYRFFWLFAFVSLPLSIFACSFPTTVMSTPSGQMAETIPPVQTLLFPTNTPALPTLMPTQAYQPVFNPAECAFPVPAGYRLYCGYLVVPENRASPNSTLIQLHVAVFLSIAEGPESDPVVHLAGGPGSSSLDVVSYLFNQGLDTVLERRDFIFFDQRGTGYSTPRLDCPERNALTPALLSGTLSDDQSFRAIVDAFQQCRNHLSAQGIDLSAYNSAASAADVNDLRLALGYEQLNLYGDSYGTRLALTVMRDYPGAVRSAVLDSTYPLEVNLYTALAPNAERAFNVLFDNCAADLTCNTSYPNLRPVFYNLVEQLNANPITVNLNVGGVEYPVLLTGDLLMDVLFVGLYNPVVTASMPRMIYQIQKGEYSILRNRLSLYFDTSGALGMGTSVQCAEEVPFNSGEDAFIAAQGVQPDIAAFFPGSVQYLFTVCQNWTGIAPNPSENQPVASDIPALILAGEFDPITPPEWGRMTAAHLTNSYYFEFRGNGHWVTRSSRCALAIMLAFLDNPLISPDASCLGSQGGLQFVP
ncbi:MAG: alpha/beta hydrolase [Anaerolineales bacterium]